MLARRPDEQTTEQERERRMVLPISDQAAQQVGTAENWAVLRGGATDHNMIAAAGASVPSVDHEFLGRQS